MIQLTWNNLPKSGYFYIFTKIWTLPCPLCTCAQWAWGGAGPKIFFSKLAIDHRKLCRKKFWNFLRSSQIFAYIVIFWNQLNLQFSELNITPSVRPNLGIFKNFRN